MANGPWGWFITGLYDFEAATSGNPMFDLIGNELQIASVMNAYPGALVSTKPMAVGSGSNPTKRFCCVFCCAAWAASQIGKCLIPLGWLC